MQVSTVKNNNIIIDKFYVLYLQKKKKKEKEKFEQYVIISKLWKFAINPIY